MLRKRETTGLSEIQIVPQRVAASQPGTVGGWKLKSRSLTLLAILVLFVVSTAGLGCTWVYLTPEGQQVRVLPLESISSCKELGRTRVRTTISIGPFARSHSKVREELTSLARNEAGRMGGNVVSIIAYSDRGEQVFGVYRCPE